MWKNWNPFRRRQKEVGDGHDDESKHDGPSQAQGEKENSLSASSNGASIGNRSNSYQVNHSFSHFDDNDSNSSPRKTSISRHESLRSRNRLGFKDQLNTTLPTPRSHVGRRITRSPDNQMNKTINVTGVQAPLLSSPIVPQIRKALESQAGTRSGVLSRQGKLVGRSSSLNYGTSRNLPKMTAGQVPWVRLKRRESLGLSDLVAGRTPQSPNTVKLAAPEPRHLPAPPSFKTTPVIVTTEPSRSRVIDTQTVVSALREKRKRFGGSQQDEMSSEDSWQGSAKRRRQDSSQSNASSVSIPQMPDTLPDLMGTPGSSLLHIENLSSQRPSTVPATVDPYTSAPVMTTKPGGHMPGFSGMPSGLGGVPQIRGLGGPDLNPINPMALPPQHLSLYRYPTFPQHLHPLQQHHGNSSLQQRQAQYLAGGSGSNVNNSKSVLRSIQSSLSSSLRTRVNEATLRQHGIDLKRIRGNTEENKRRLSFSTQTPARAMGSPEEPVQKVPKPSQQPRASTGTTDQQEQKSNQKQTVDQSEEQPKEQTVSTPTKRKIAEGVMLRKQNMSITPTASPARPLRVLPASTLVSADDFEKDRQQEYRRRVLDMLGGSEDGDTETVDSTATPSTAPTATTTSLLTTATSSTTVAPQASASTINASLASLSKLVQATTPGAGTAAATTTSSGTPASITAKPANSLLQLLKADESEIIKLSGRDVTLTGKPLASPSSDQKTSSISSVLTPSSVSVAATATLSTPATTTAASAAAAGLSQAGATSGFQVNFGAAFSQASKPALPSGFSFGTTPAATSVTTPASNNTTTPATPNFAGLGTGSAGTPGEVLSAIATLAATLGSNSGAASALAPQPSQARNTGPTPFGFGAGGTTSLAPASQALTTSSTAPPTGGFNFNMATPAPAATSTVVVGLNFATGLGTNATPGSTLTTTSAPLLSTPGFNFAGVSSLATATSATTNTSSTNPGFTFGATSLSTASSTQATDGLGLLSGGNQPAMTATGFQGFGAAGGASIQTSQTAPSGFGNFTQNSGKPDQPAPSLSGLQPPAQHPAPVFGSNTTFGAGVVSALTKTTVSTGSGFGVISNVPAAFNFSGTSSSAGQAESKPFTFGASASSTTATPSAVTFGAAAPAGLTVFGGASALGTGAAPPAFGATAGAGFGGSTAATTTTSSATMFGAAASGFGAAAAPASSVPAFGSAPVSAFGAATTSASGFGGAGGGFTFGSGQQTSATAGTTGFGTVAAPAFGSSTFSSTAAPPAFGSSTATSFGAAVKPSPFGAAAGTSGGFGAPTTQPPAFGMGSGVASAFGSTQLQTTQASSTPFVFGAGAQTQQPATGGSQPFMFGATPATSSQVSAFGSTTGAASSVPPFGQPQAATNSIFGSGAGTNKPAFGTSAAASAFGTGNSSSIAPAPAFGTGNSSATAPAFGTGNSTATASAFGSSLASPPAFGSSTQQPKPAGAPAFGSTAFGAGMSQGNAFGSNPGASASTGVASPFGGANAFGTSTAKPNPFGAGASATGAAASVFSFSGNQPQQPQAASVFGSGPSAGGPVPSAFNFGGQAASGGSQPQPQAGAFNFSARPSFATPGPVPGGFNFAAAAGSTPSFNFSGTPASNMAVPQPGSTPRPRIAATRRVGNRRAPRR